MILEWLKNFLGMGDFIRTRTSEANDTGFITSFRVVPDSVVAAFGQPNEEDDGKSTGIFVFKGRGQVWTVYDWKSRLGSKFWKSTKPQRVNVGGRLDQTKAQAREFILWLQENLR